MKILEDLRDRYDSRMRAVKYSNSIDLFQKNRGARFMVNKVIRDVKSGMPIKDAIMRREKMLDLTISGLRGGRTTPFLSGQRKALEDIRENIKFW